MRLNRHELNVFAAVLGSRLKQRQARLYLFGSRTEDRLKGGDIDLLVLAPVEVIKNLRSEKHSLLAEFKKELGEQRIDLTLAEAAKARQDPFLRLALRTAILLKKWK